MPRIIPAIFTDDAHDFRRMLAASEEFAPEVHIDVTDGVFAGRRSVPVASLMEAKPAIPVELHLMVKEPLDALDQLRGTSVKRIIVHWETLGEIGPALSLLRRQEFVPGLAVNPDTAIDTVSPWLAELNQVLVMGVAPGERGGALVVEVPHKIRTLRMIWPNGTISADGGMNAETIPEVARGGADRIIVATAIWQSADPRSAYQALQDVADRSAQAE